MTHVIVYIVIGDNTCFHQLRNAERRLADGESIDFLSLHRYMMRLSVAAQDVSVRYASRMIDKFCILMVFNDRSPGAVSEEHAGRPVLHIYQRRYFFTSYYESISASP